MLLYTYMSDGTRMNKVRSLGYVGMSTRGMRPPVYFALKYFIAEHRQTDKPHVHECHTNSTQSSSSHEEIHLLTVHELGDVALHKHVLTLP